MKNDLDFGPQQLSRALQPHLPASRWLVGLSGGLDSTALVSALVAAKPEQPIVAIHVNHGLSLQADAWQRHCQALCRDWSVECRVEKIQVQPSGRGVEDAARAARYRAFRSHIRPGDVLLLGHHRDDQAETLLFRLMRGAGPKGLGAIVAQRDFAGGRIVRPLLTFGKADLERYAVGVGLTWISDESNADESFDRNFLRRQVMPLLARRWPNFPERWRLTAEACQQADRLGGDLAAIDLQACNERTERWGWSINWMGLRQLPVYRRDNLLRHWADRRGIAIMGRKHLQEIHRQVFRGAAHALVQWPGGALRYYSDRVYLTPPEPPLPTPEPFGWRLDRAVELRDGTQLSAHPGTAGLYAPGGHVEVRWRCGGERCRPAQRGHSQTVKKLLQEYRLEPWLRRRVPLIYVDGQLAAVGDLWICHDFIAARGKPGYRLQWDPLQAAGDPCSTENPDN